MDAGVPVRAAPRHPLASGDVARLGRAPPRRPRRGAARAASGRHRARRRGSPRDVVAGGLRRGPTQGRVVPTPRRRWWARRRRRPPRRTRRARSHGGRRPAARYQASGPCSAAALGEPPRVRGRRGAAGSPDSRSAGAEGAGEHELGQHRHLHGEGVPAAQRLQRPGHRLGQRARVRGRQHGQGVDPVGVVGAEVPGDRATPVVTHDVRAADTPAASSTARTSAARALTR